MEPIERQIAERKALLQEWAAEIDRLETAKAGMSERDRLETERRISRLGYKIHCGEYALEDLEELAAEGRAQKPKRPPLPNARRLDVVERQRIEQETRAELSASLNLNASEIHVHVGRITDAEGNPQIAISIGSARIYRQGPRTEDDR